MKLRCRPAKACRAKKAKKAMEPIDSAIFDDQDVKNAERLLAEEAARKNDGAEDGEEGEEEEVPDGEEGEEKEVPAAEGAAPTAAKRVKGKRALKRPSASTKGAPKAGMKGAAKAAAKKEGTAAKEKKSDADGPGDTVAAAAEPAEASSGSAGARQIVPHTGADESHGLSLELQAAISICGRCHNVLDPLRAHQKSEKVFHCHKCNSRGVQLRNLDNWDEVSSMLASASPEDEEKFWNSIIDVPNKKDLAKAVETHMTRVSCREPLFHYDFSFCKLCNCPVQNCVF